MNKLGLVAFGLVLCLGGGVAAQQKGAEALQQAILREESERDDAAAARMYRAVAEDAAADPEVRVQAFERLVKLLRRTGGFTEQRQALESLADAIGGGGRSVLAKVGAEESELQQRAEQILATRFPSADATAALKLIGTQAAPVLARRARVDELHLVQGYVPLLMELDRDAATSFWADVPRIDDILRRRTIALAVQGHEQHLSKAQASACRAWLTDPDPRVRAAILYCGRVREQLALREVLGFLRDPDQGVRHAVYIKWPDLRADEVQLVAEFLGELLEQQDEGLRAATAKQLIDAWRSGAASGVHFANELVVKYFLDVLGRGYGSVGGIPPSIPHLAPQPASSLAAVARRIGPVEPSRNDVESRVLMLFVAVSLPSWSEDDMDAVLELVDRGYANWNFAGEWSARLGDWVAEHTTPGNAPTIASRVERLSSNENRLAPLRRLRWPASAVPGLLRAFGEYREQIENRLRNQPSRRTGVSLFGLVQAATEDADAALLEAAGSRAEIYSEVVSTVEECDSTRPSLLRGLLLTKPVDRDDAEARDLVFRRIVDHRLTGLIPDLARAYELTLPEIFGGISHVFMAKAGQRGVVARPFDAWFDGPDAVQLLDRCRQTGGAKFWRHCQEGLRQSALHSRARIPAAVVRWLAAQVESLPSEWTSVGHLSLELLLRSEVDEGEKRAAMVKALESHDGGLLRTALTAIQRRDATLDPLVRQTLESSSDSVQMCAINAAVRIVQAPEIVDWLRPIARDDNDNVRVAIAGLPAQFPHRAWVPLLLEFLRDPDERVRNTAQASLERLQFYFDQVERWERWQKGTSLDSPNAAEALLAQASPDQPKPKRLAAITSLGTLGVPETLPLLIDWMNDSDPDIAKAASEAVTRINERKR